MKCSLICLVCLATTLSFSTRAASAETSAAEPPASQPVTTQSSSSPAPLSGGIVSSALSTEASLKELGKIWHHLKSAAWDTFCETQQPVTFYVGGPDVIGGMVIPAINGTGSISTGEFLPPREKWLKYYASEITYLLPLIKNETATLQLPADSDAEASEQLAQMKVIAAALPAEVDKLAALCQNPPYKNMTVATAAQQLINDLDAYEKLRKQIDKVIKDDVKMLKRKRGK